MKIQLLTYDVEPKAYNGVDMNSINAPMAFDSYDTGIVG